jgi:hypothetical protein
VGVRGSGWLRTTALGQRDQVQVSVYGPWDYRFLLIAPRIVALFLPKALPRVGGGGHYPGHRKSRTGCGEAVAAGPCRAGRVRRGPPYPLTRRQAPRGIAPAPSFFGGPGVVAPTWLKSRLRPRTGPELIERQDLSSASMALPSGR